MGRTRFSEMNCGIGQALEVLGDWWTLLIVRDAFSACAASATSSTVSA
jgi:DNA-binding HxlR family transcriptional regulator